MPVRRTAIAAVVAAVLHASAARAADPSKQECVAANESAQDLQRTGKLIEARVQLATCVAATCPAAVRADCAQRLEEVGRVQPTLILAAKDAAGGDLGAVRVTMDGKALVDRLDGNAVPVDPGEHRFVFEADGFAPVDKTVVVRVAEKDRVVVAVLAPRPVAAPPVPPPAAVAPPPPATSVAPTPVAPPPPASEPGGGHAAAWAALGVGAAGLVAGAVFTVLWAQAKHDGDAACGTPGSCDAPTANDWESKQRNDTIGLAAGFGVAAAGAVVGVLLLSSGHDERPVATGPRGLVVRF